MSEIVLEAVTKRFPDGTEAVKAASFTIHDGEFFILVGPSGCGKSTLLNMIVGLEAISEGEIRVDGKVVNAVDPKDRNMAMVFQSYAIYPHMTVWENMAFPLKLARLPKAEIETRVSKAATILELGELLGRRPASLSGGQRQRVAMGRAIVREPAVFLLDEPLSNLDAKLRVQMRTELARIQRRLATTTVYVTHDQTEAMTLGERIAVMNRGEIQQIGTPRELYTAPSNLFVAGFIGSPAMNLLPARRQGDRLTLPMVEFELPDHLQRCLPAGRDRFIAGIRAEHFHLGQGQPGFRLASDVIEWTGADLFAYFRIDAKPPITLTVRLDAAIEAVEGQDMDLWFDIEKLHLFDVDTGENLTRGR